MAITTGIFFTITSKCEHCAPQRAQAMLTRSRLRVADWSSQLHERLFNELQVRSVHFPRILILRHIDISFRQATDFSNIGANRDELFCALFITQFADGATDLSVA